MGPQLSTSIIFPLNEHAASAGIMKVIQISIEHFLNYVSTAQKATGSMPLRPPQQIKCGIMHIARSCSGMDSLGSQLSCRHLAAVAGLVEWLIRLAECLLDTNVANPMMRSRKH